jgi:hypothetical protein
VHDLLKPRDRCVIQPGLAALVADLGFDISHDHNGRSQIDGVGDTPGAASATAQGTETLRVRTHQVLLVRQSGSNSSRLGSYTVMM